MSRKKTGSVNLPVHESSGRFLWEVSMIKAITKKELEPIIFIRPNKINTVFPLTSEIFLRGRLVGEEFYFVKENYFLHQKKCMFVSLKSLKINLK